MENKPFVVAVDFDDTCVFGQYPQIGADIPGAAESLGRLENRGVKIVLLTMREGDQLDEAVNWFVARGIPLHGINFNPDPVWTDCRKVFADMYIDDRGVGVPVTEAGVLDWQAIEKLVLSEWRKRGGSGLQPVTQQFKEEQDE